MDARATRRHFLYGGAAAGAGLWLPFDVLDADARGRRKSRWLVPATSPPA